MMSWFSIHFWYDYLTLKSTNQDWMITCLVKCFLGNHENLIMIPSNHIKEPGSCAHNPSTGERYRRILGACWATGLI